MALSRRRGPSGTSMPKGEFDDISNPLARERYARSFLDEKLRGMIAGREAEKAGPDLARRGLGLQERGLEEQIRSEMAGEGMRGRGMDIEESLGNRRLGMEEQFGADRRLGMEREFGLGERGAGLAERSLEEQIRANMAGEDVARRQVGVLETTGGSKDPEKVAAAAAINQQTRAGNQAALTEWVAQPHIQRRIGEFFRKKDVNGAVQFIIENGPVESTPADVRRVLTEIIAAISGGMGQLDEEYGKGPMSDANTLIREALMKEIGQAGR